MVWKLGDRVIYADRVHIGKDLRASIIDNTSLVLTGVDTQYTGKLKIPMHSGTKIENLSDFGKKLEFFFLTRTSN